MNEERIDRLEQRVSALEALVRELVGKRGSGEAGQGIAGQQVPPSAQTTAGRTSPRPRVAASAPTSSPLPHFPASPLSSEQWIGQRALLAIGVIALILAAGYLLRLSFDRGWISPLMRCVGGAFGGILVGALGWRLQRRYRVYGAALIGCGAAIIYLSVWAAARLYGVLPPTTGIVGLALVSIALAMIAYAIDVEALGATAALGAFFAPLLLGRNYADADLLLLYLACMATGLGLVAARRRWRLAMFVIALSFFGVAYAGAADRGTPWAVLLYGVIGGSAGLHVGLRERWWETRFLSFAGGWTFVAAANHHLDRPFEVVLAGMVLAAPVWWHALVTDRILPPQVAVGKAPDWSPGEALYFFLTPLLLGWALYQVAPLWFDQNRGLVPLLVAVPYLFAGYQQLRVPFALVGAAALGLSVWQHWNEAARVWGLLGLVVLWATLDHRLNRYDGRWYALGTLGAALLQLFGEALAARNAADPAFVGSYALAMWGTAAVSVTLATGLWRRTAPVDPAVRGGLWALGGGLILFGVTAEIHRYFYLKSAFWSTASLASSLAVSAWWLIFAAGLVGIGFKRDLRPARLAGLGVAGLAVIKVLLFDLSSLDALYRVGSVFILGLVLLLLAYLYHRQGRNAAGQPRENLL
jgi:uncharacterized membrane protein